MSLPLCAFAVAALLCKAGCGTSEPSFSPCDPREVTAVDSAGIEYRYLVNTIELPSASTEALDLNEDSRGDNALGGYFAFFKKNLDYDLSVDVNALVESGELLQLIDVRATSLDDADGVGVRVAVGQDLDADPSDNHSGQEPLAFDTSIAVGQMSGGLLGGRISVNLGTVSLLLTLPELGEPFLFPLTGARLEATITEDGLQGQIAGGISAEYVESAVLPALVLGFERAIVRDCPAQQCVVGSFGELLLHFFDVDLDYVIELDELRENSLIGASIRNPDLDLYDENGDFAPGCDDVDDSLSLMVGFTAVRAAFSGS